MAMEDAKQTFLLESGELLEDMERSLLALEQSPDDQDLINAVFRAAHTIKGSGGLFGFDAVQRFTHRVESVLDRVRGGKLSLDGELNAVLLECRDHIGELVQLAVADAEADAEVQQRGAALEARLARYLPDAAPAAGSAASAAKAAPVQRKGQWHVSLRFKPDLLRNGFDPQALLRYLGTLGEVIGVYTLDDAVPELPKLDPHAAYLGLELDLVTDAPRERIEEAFDFFRDDTDIRIVPPGAEAAEFLKLIQELPEEDLRLGEILVQGGAITREALDRALAAQTGAGASARIGDILVAEGKVSPAVVEAAADRQQRARTGAEPGRHSVRVDAEKLDRLINLVGELVIAGASNGVLTHQFGNELLRESHSAMSRLVEEIRDSALKLRMVPIAETFNKFQRVVHDYSRGSGKVIRLEISGAETELDKTMVEKLGDPLLHLVRNSMDHGIEPEAIRVAAGKPAEGSLRLEACHDSGSILIQVKDDGRGIDAARVLAKARERNLVGPDQELTEQEIYQLIFAPGFSTAEVVTNVSGRGVGMDVVKRNIEALRGSVEIDSRPGEGTTISIRMPLTLAIIDGFVVGVGSSAYVIPLDAVIECVQASDYERRQTADSAHYLDLRGELLPYVRLGELFQERTRDDARENIVVVQYAGQKAGLVVDELLGELQTVIKPLGKLFRGLRGVSGATILGDGNVAVILDVPQLIQAVVNRGSWHVGSAVTMH